MSITNEPEAAENEPQPARGSVLESVMNTIRALGYPFSYSLSQHAAHEHHEDIPDDAVKAPKAALPTALMADSLRTSVAVADPKCPDRLRSLLPPANYGAVVPGSVYRSSYPRVENYEFLKSLELKTILTLVPEEISPEYSNFMAEAGIQHFQVHIPANKGQVRIQSCQISRAMGIVLDRTNHPMLIHCNKGKHRTGCVVGCLRMIQGAEVDDIREEYHAYAEDKPRYLDEAFIDIFDERTVLWMARKYNWILPIAEDPPASPVATLSVAKPRA